MSPIKIKEGLEKLMEYGTKSERELFIFRTGLEYFYIKI